MATIWKGAISFGLVTIPANLEPAVRERSGLAFRQLHRADLSPIKMERVCSRDRAPVPWGEIVKGFEYAPDRFVVMEKADLDAAAPPRSKLLELEPFVALADNDPRFCDPPDQQRPRAPGEKAYALLREALRETERVGIGKITLREKQHLAAVRPSGDALIVQFMRFAPDLVDVDAYAFPAASAVRPQELAMARQLVENLSEPFEPPKAPAADKFTTEELPNIELATRAADAGAAPGQEWWTAFHSPKLDETTERLRAVIDAKLAGMDVPHEEMDVEPEGTRVIDLMARLEESLKRPRGGARSSSKRTRR